jgi:GNAT superfamily N-acetyltransferase
MRQEALILESPLEAAQLVIRPLTADDSESYRALRKKILEMGDGKYFSDSYERERKFTAEQEWREWCTETQEHCTIGTFIGEELVGTMGIVMYGLPQNRTAEWEVTWLDPQYRKLGIAKLAYEKVQQWTKDHGYEYAIVFIRDGNMRSRKIREQQGAVYFYTKRSQIWADGSVADVHCFMLDLSSARSGQDKPYDRAARHMEAILASLKHEADSIPDGERAIA